MTSQTLLRLPPAVAARRPRRAADPLDRRRGAALRRGPRGGDDVCRGPGCRARPRPREPVGVCRVVGWRSQPPPRLGGVGDPRLPAAAGRAGHVAGARRAASGAAGRGDDGAHGAHRRAGEVERHRAAEPEDPPAVPRPDRRPSRRLPAVDGMRWLAGDFHSHTVHSDGVLSVGGLAALAASRGLDFLAVTDHNTTSHHAHLPEAARTHGIVLVPGQEVTRDVGHANVFGDVGLVDFRTPPETWAAAPRAGRRAVDQPPARCRLRLAAAGRRARRWPRCGTRRGRRCRRGERRWPGGC